jgi:hypothetical protein
MGYAIRMDESSASDPDSFNPDPGYFLNPIRIWILIPVKIQKFSKDILPVSLKLVKGLFRSRKTPKNRVTVSIYRIKQVIFFQDLEPSSASTSQKVKNIVLSTASRLP